MLICSDDPHLSHQTWAVLGPAPQTSEKRERTFTFSLLQTSSTFLEKSTFTFFILQIRLYFPDSADLHHFHNLVCQCLPNARQGQGLLPSGKQIEPCVRFVKVVKDNFSPILVRARAYILSCENLNVDIMYQQRFPKKRNHQSFLILIVSSPSKIPPTWDDWGDGYHCPRVMYD